MTAKYDRKRQTATKRSRAIADAGKDIGTLPPIADVRRHVAARKSFRVFCETYFPDVFSLEWSPDHITVIGRIERAVTHGALFAMAMPRGSGKSALIRTAALWAVLTGLRQYVAIIASTKGKAQDELATIKTICETTPDLAADWPHVFYPITQLARVTQRQRGQTYRGAHTRIEWLNDKIVLPTIAGSQSSGAVITASGLQSEDIRGQNHQRADGTNIRPDLVLLDDPQTTESAWSQLQTTRRTSLLAGDVLGMAGPGKRIAGLMACTIIRPGDMADQILDPKQHPEWQGQRTKMLYSFPTNATLWDEYAERRKAEQIAGGTGKAATDFYRRNRKAMDKGAKAAWPARFADDEISAVQNAMNLWIRDEPAFFAEYQNEPLTDAADDETLTPDPAQIATRVNTYARRSPPDDTDKITASIDVQKRALYYTVTAWTPTFSGAIIDYGTFPDQHTTRFHYRTIKRTLGRAFPKHGYEAQLTRALAELTAYLFGDNWQGHKLDLLLIDANWSESRDVIYSYARQSRLPIIPSHGKYIGASARPMAEWTSKAKRGLNWQSPPPKPRQPRHVIFDTNYWKTFLAQRLTTPIGDPGALTLFKSRSHAGFIDHLAAETPIKTESRGRIVYEWKQRPERPDNHWLDCAVGTAVAANIVGINLPSMTKARRRTVRTTRKSGKVSYL